MSTVAVAVAVLTQPGPAADQLREALDQAGAEVVWQGPPDQLELGQLPGDVVVVNLDPDTEAQLARIEALLEDGTVRVVFNDATVSAGLSGWDLQRWARHLAAKVLSSGDSGELPEPPPGAEPLSVRAPAAVATIESEAAPVSLRVPGHQYIEDVISAELGEPPLPYQGPGGLDAGATVVASERAATQASPAPESTARTPPVDAPPVDAEPASRDATAGADETHLGGLSLEAMDTGEPSQSVDDVERPADPALVFTDDLDLIAPVDAPTAPGQVEEDVAEADREGVEDSGGMFFGELSLEPLDLGETDEEAPAKEATTAEPAPAAVARGTPAPAAERESNLALDRTADTDAPGAPSAASGQAAAAPRQLWVLGGALGGPEAITQFINALPKEVDTAFLAVIHFDRGNAESFARSLGASSRRTVAVAGVGAGTRAEAGGLLLAPEGSRVIIDRDGAVSVETLDSPVGLVDQCARAAADAFGMDAGIILFSGGARDGFEGALYMAQRGGVVWAQDPATCVAGGMAEAVRGRGIATFIGSPRALAEHFVQEFC